MATFRIKALDFANLSARYQRGAPRRAWEDAKGDRQEEPRETKVRSGSVRPGPRVIRLASSTTKDRVTSERADNLHTRPLQLRLRRRRESHRSLTMPRGDGLSPDCDT